MMIGIFGHLLINFGILLIKKIPPPRLERGSLPPEGSALSTELWGHKIYFTMDAILEFLLQNKQQMIIIQKPKDLLIFAKLSDLPFGTKDLLHLLHF
jgi:hypothetical protein